MKAFIVCVLFLSVVSVATALRLAPRSLSPSAMFRMSARGAVAPEQNAVEDNVNGKWNPFQWEAASLHTLEGHKSSLEGDSGAGSFDWFFEFFSFLCFSDIAAVPALKSGSDPPPAVAASAWFRAESIISHA